MKIDIDTLIYLLVVIIFGILGAIGNRKKPAAPAGNQENPELTGDEQDNSGDVFSENLRRLMGNYNEYDTEDSIITDEDLELEMAEKKIGDRAGIIDTIEDKAEQLEETREDERGKKEMEQSMQALEDNISDTIKLGEVGSEREVMGLPADDFRFLDRFDMRKAVIYSEILHPKYF